MIITSEQEISDILIPLGFIREDLFLGTYAIAEQTFRFLIFSHNDIVVFPTYGSIYNESFKYGQLTTEELEKCAKKFIKSYKEWNVNVKLKNLSKDF